MLELLVAVFIFLVVMRVGLFVIRALAQPPPPPPPAGEMRRVNLRYRCSTCGVELKITAAPDEDPPPPRHCQEEMQLVAPIE
jgi:DNA-directed RNA polymerase subunit RPC12/RpoP